MIKYLDEEGYVCLKEFIKEEIAMPEIKRGYRIHSCLKNEYNIVLDRRNRIIIDPKRKRCYDFEFKQEIEYDLSNIIRIYDQNDKKIWERGE